MLGRGLLANPALALMIKQGEAAALAWADLQPLLQDFWGLVIQRTLPQTQCGRMKQWLNYLRMAYPEAEAVFQTVRRITSPEQMEVVMFSGPFQ